MVSFCKENWKAKDAGQYAPQPERSSALSPTVPPTLFVRADEVIE